MVVWIDTSKLRRLRLLTPTSGVRSRSARSSSAASCTSTSTAMPRPSAMASKSFICASSRQAAISRMQSAPDGARLVDLPGIDHEVLAQHRQVAGGARLLEVVDAALEELPVGQHREAGRADCAVAFGIALRDVGRDELALADHALARAGLLDLGDHRGLAGGDLAAQRALEVAREHAALGVGPDRLERGLFFAAGDFLVLDRDDLVQDVRHRLQAPRLRPWP